jgi:hypothetical protein
MKDLLLCLHGIYIKYFMKSFYSKKSQVISLRIFHSLQYDNTAIIDRGDNTSIINCRDNTSIINRGANAYL